MVLGYFTSQIFLYGWGAALSEIPGNAVQAVTSVIIAMPLTVALERAGVGRRAM